MRRLIILTLILIGFLSLPSCKMDCGDENSAGSPLCNGGTGTGNPAEPNAGVTVPDNQQGAGRLMTAVCNKLSACHPELTVQQCRSEFASRADVDLEIGVPEGAYTSYQELITNELNGYRLSNPASVNACVTEIQALACDSYEVANAYLPSETDPFMGVTALFAPVCEGAFTP